MLYGSGIIKCFLPLIHHPQSQNRIVSDGVYMFGFHQKLVLFHVYNLDVYMYITHCLINNFKASFKKKNHVEQIAKNNQDSCEVEERKAGIHLTI